MQANPEVARCLIDMQTCLLKFVPSEIIHELAWFLREYQFMLGGAYATEEHELLFIGALIRDQNLGLLDSFLDKVKCHHVQELVRSRDPNVIEWTLTRMEKGSIPLGFLIERHLWIPVSVPGYTPARFMDRFQSLSIIENEQSLKAPLHGGGMCERYIRETLEPETRNIEGFAWALDHGYEVPTDWIFHHLDNDVLKCLVYRKLYIKMKQTWITPEYVAGNVPQSYTKDQIRETVEMLNEVCKWGLSDVQRDEFCKEAKRYHDGKKISHVTVSTMNHHSGFNSP